MPFYSGFYTELYGRFPRVTHPFAISNGYSFVIQLACVKPIARVHSGPGSNPYLSSEVGIEPTT